MIAKESVMTLCQRCNYNLHNECSCFGFNLCYNLHSPLCDAHFVYQVCFLSRDSVAWDVHNGKMYKRDPTEEDSTCCKYEGWLAGTLLIRERERDGIENAKKQ